MTGYIRKKLPPIDACMPQFEAAVKAVLGEMRYQDNLQRRTTDEAKDVPGFLLLLQVYIDKTAVIWADNPGELQADGQTQVTEALNGLRKIAAIAIRAMVHNGVRERINVAPDDRTPMSLPEALRKVAADLQARSGPVDHTRQTGNAFERLAELIT